MMNTTLCQLDQRRSNVAFNRIISLREEEQAIYTRAAGRLIGLTNSDRARLNEIMLELALAQDERNRARCGAPPAPSDYNPFIAPPIVEEVQEETETKALNQRGQCRTTIEEVYEMRRLYNEDGLSYTDVWREFSYLSETTVRYILKNRLWHDPEYIPRTKKAKVKDVVRHRTRPELDT